MPGSPEIKALIDLANRRLLGAVVRPNSRQKPRNALVLEVHELSHSERMR